MTAKDEHRIKRALQKRNWRESKYSDSWSVFKIMSEFVEGFETMRRLGPCVSIFGSARTAPENKYYQIAVDIARQLADAGFGVITGGGPGIMEAGNKGAKENNGTSVGLNINLPFEQTHNAFIDQDKLVTFDYFFVRKVMFIRYAQGFIVLPGGFGTLDELFEALTLIQTEKIAEFPIVLVGKKYWEGLFFWIREVMLAEEHNINAEDLNLAHIVDTPAEAVQVITDFYHKYTIGPNF
jgi:uncharacterized protein (TIGR00730 family)